VPFVSQEVKIWIAIISILAMTVALGYATVKREEIRTYFSTEEAQKVERENATQKLDLEFSYAREVSERVDKDLRSAVNIESLNIRNCAGSLSAAKGKSFFEGSSLFEEIYADPKRNVTIVYDLCSMDSEKGSPISLMAFTEDMISIYNVKKIVNGETVEYIPVISSGSEEGKRVRTKKALVAIEDIAEFL